MSDLITYFLPAHFPPVWAVGWGEDREGVFADLPLPAGARTMEMRWIPPGTFTMGSPDTEAGRFIDEDPTYEVTLSEGFWLARTPCTREQWFAVMKGEDKEKEKQPNIGHSPMTWISWLDCMAFCEQLGACFPGTELRLPTEAQWEYACRAGMTSAFNDGSECTKPAGKDPALDKLGWFKENSGGGTHPVGDKQPNAWGLYDMHGNVWEWCRDWYGPYAGEAQVDPVGRDSGQDRVLRGGSCWSIAKHCRSACRNRRAPTRRLNCIGFRLAAGQSQ